MMTQQDFARLARELRVVRPYDRMELVVWRQCVEAVGLACKASNQRFDYGRFLAACEQEVTT